MHNSIASFNRSIVEARQSGELYVLIKEKLGVPLELDDLLRAQVVYAVSAFDKLMHDLIRIGMRMQYEGTRPPTAKYLAEPLPISAHQAMTNAVFPHTPSTLFEAAIFQKHSYLSFQDPDKISDGLSFIWGEKSKWEKIALQAGFVNGDSLRTQLKLLAARRNAIVHEADMDPMTYMKRSISKQDADTWVDLTEKCGNAIAALVV